MKQHDHYMRKALELAQQALDQDEFPVGCVIVYNGKIIARGERKGTRQQSPGELDHAEMLALRQLENTSTPIDRRQAILYATMEPCLMCFGAILISGIGTIVYGYEDAMGGGTRCNTTNMPPLYNGNRVEIISHICRPESLRLFKNFFSRPHINYWKESFLAEYTLAQSD